MAGSHCRDSVWRLSSSISRSKFERYCFTFRAIWASSYNFLALRKELRRTRFLWPPVCATSSTAAFVLPWLRDLKWREERKGGGKRGKVWLSPTQYQLINMKHAKDHMNVSLWSKLSCLIPVSQTAITDRRTRVRKYFYLVTSTISITHIF